MILETERLYLREMTHEDEKDLSEMLQDPKVMYAYEHNFSDTDVQIWLDRQLARYHKDGFGLW
ncbi:MAG: GNAT family N-acetyltransferase, partial [Beduini sp.]